VASRRVRRRHWRAADTSSRKANIRSDRASGAARVPRRCGVRPRALGKRRPLAFARREAEVSWHAAGGAAAAIALSAQGRTGGLHMIALEECEGSTVPELAHWPRLWFPAA